MSVATDIKVTPREREILLWLSKRQDHRCYLRDSRHQSKHCQHLQARDDGQVRRGERHGSRRIGTAASHHHLNEESSMGGKSKKPKSNAERRRGRPCKTDVNRNASGRITNKPGEAPDRLGKDTRVRLFNVAPEDAAQPEAGSVIGRMKLSGEISHEQYEAFIRYNMTVERYRSAMMSPDSLKTRRGGVMNIPDDSSDIAAVAAWISLEKAISAEQRFHRGNLMAPLNFIVSRNEEHPHMVGDLRVVGNVLSRFYGIAFQRKSA